MAELVDACVSGAHAARCAGSSPVLGTSTKCCAPYMGPPQILICGESGAPEYFLWERGFQTCTRDANASAGGEIGIHATLRG